ncbi:MAG TPA: extradiol ring-cleavage dioxygenase [Candidatus Binatia bacterium]
MGAIIGALIVTHTPRIANEATAPDFTREMIGAMHELGKVVARLRPDVLVQASTHWVTTFNHYVLAHERHKGVLTSSEAPEIIAGMPYDFPGDPELAGAIAAQASARGIPAIATAAEPFMLEYGTVNPIQYLTPKFDVPVVPVSSCILADIPECLRFGEAVGEAIRASSRRAVVVASGALSHKLVRGPEKWPKDEDRKLDQKFIELATQGRAEEIKAFFPSFCKTVEAEMGGRHVAMLLGATGGTFKGRLHAYGPSSGTGNPVMSLEPG